MGTNPIPTTIEQLLYGAANCIDGVINPANRSICHTSETATPWIAIDYGTSVTVERVEIFNRHHCCGSRTKNVDVRISNELPTSETQMFSGGTLLGHFAGPGTDGQHIGISGQAASGRYVIVQMDNGGLPMNLDEVKAFGSFTPRGCIEEYGIDFYGRDIPGGMKTTADSQECADFAASITGGLYWTFKKNEKMCYVKSSNSGRTTNGLAVSGSRKCGWSSIFEKSAPFELKRNALLTTLPSLPREWMVEFEFKPTIFDHSGWSNIFHMTIGGDQRAIGDRIPAVFYHPSSGLGIRSHVNKNPAYAKQFDSLPIGEWTKIRVSQELLGGKFRYRIFIDEKEETNVENSRAVGFENVKVFAADPWYEAQPGSIKSLKISVKGN